MGTQEGAAVPQPGREGQKKQPYLLLCLTFTAWWLKALSLWHIRAGQPDEHVPASDTEGPPVCIGACHGEGRQGHVRGPRGGLGPPLGTLHHDLPLGYFLHFTDSVTEEDEVTSPGTREYRGSSLLSISLFQIAASVTSPHGFLKAA